ncbi:MAG: M20/M25/M40 family metallo-hydrolase [Planctomycetes bacterium]|jgi:endoglucanase|nr:M42 family metallopeptidase [Phycisphaerae bacterium]NBB94434.1 M20/M25/M40 family metallo-hydrolase [Planctomycetota bacterium]
MQRESKNFLMSLLTTPSPSGHESAAQKLWCDYVRDAADDVKTDAYGNAVAVVKGSGGPKILLDGHMDEIGMMVKHIDDKGFVYIQRIGGVNAALCSGKRVNIHAAKGIVRGVIGATAIHLIDKDKDQKPPKWHELFIDIGVKDGKAARKRIAVGDAVTFVDDFEQLDRNIAIARAFDNRIGCFLIAEVLRKVAAGRRKPTCSLYACSSVQEETGCNGAQMNVANVKPDVAIAVEVTHATDTPGIDAKKHGEVTMGDGPTVSIGREHHPVVVRRLRDVAEAKNIDYQVETFSLTGGTDAYVMWNKIGGVPAALISIPTRYMHSTVEMVDLRDLAKGIDWLAEFVLDVKKGESFKIKV